MNTRFLVVAAIVLSVAACSGDRMTSSQMDEIGEDSFAALTKPANPKANGPAGKSNVAHAYVAPVANESAWGRAKHNSAGTSFDVKANFHGLIAGRSYRVRVLGVDTLGDFTADAEGNAEFVASITRRPLLRELERLSNRPLVDRPNFILRDRVRRVIVARSGKFRFDFTP